MVNHFVLKRVSMPSLSWITRDLIPISFTNKSVFRLILIDGDLLIRSVRLI